MKSPERDILEKIIATIKKYRMLYGGESVLIGLSGGPDSVCLTVTLKKLSDRFRLKLSAMYIDHGLRPEETGKEIEFCQSLTNSLGIGFTSRAVDVKGFAKAKGLNLQEAGRILRYAALEEEALKTKAERIALGHTLDDNVETFLMNLLRGSGITGLSSIPPVRGKIIRPLIETSRSDIENYLKTINTPYVIDSSNLKTDYKRNKLRAELIPHLKAFNPHFLDTISHTIDILGEEDRYLEVSVTKTLMKLISRKTENSIELFVQPLENLDRVILRRTLRRAIAETRGLRSIGFVHIEDIIRLIKEGKPGDRISLPKGIRVIKKYSTILLTAEPVRRIGLYELPENGEVFIEEAGLVIRANISETPPTQDKSTATLDAEKLSFPLLVRARQNGDYFYPSGFGKRKKLQDFFVDEKIPRDERDTVPIVVSGPDIVWVAGMRADERYCATPKTRKFLILSVKPARI